MSGHTKEPWTYDEEFIYAESIGAYVADVRTDDMTSGRYIAMKDANAVIDANARRIVACVNACEGIPNGNLEAGGVFETVRKERDELLAALKYIANYEDDFCVMPQTLQEIALKTIEKYSND